MVIKRKGFTLLELVVAVGIMLIIAAAATPFLLSHIRDSKIAAVNENLINLKTAFDSYFTKEGGSITASNILQDMVSKGWISPIPEKNGMSWSVEATTGASGNAYYVFINGNAEALKYFGDLVGDLDKSVDGTDGADAGRLLYKKVTTQGQEDLDICYLLYKDPGFTPNQQETWAGTNCQ